MCSGVPCATGGCLPPGGPPHTTRARVASSTPAAAHRQPGRPPPPPSRCFDPEASSGEALERTARAACEEFCRGERRLRMGCGRVACGCVAGPVPPVWGARAQLMVPNFWASGHPSPPHPSCCRLPAFAGLLWTLSYYTTGTLRRPVLLPDSSPDPSRPQSLPPCPPWYAPPPLPGLPERPPRSAHAPGTPPVHADAAGQATGAEAEGDGSSGGGGLDESDEEGLGAPASSAAGGRIKVCVGLGVGAGALGSPRQSTLGALTCSVVDFTAADPRPPPPSPATQGAEAVGCKEAAGSQPGGCGAQRWRRGHALRLLGLAVPL